MPRPKIEIDWKQFETLCATQCTLREIADYFNVAEITIERKVKERYNCCFVDAFKRKRQVGLLSLRSNLFKLAQKQGNVAIFLAKNWLGMTDRHELTGAEGQPLISPKIIVQSPKSKDLTEKIIEGENT